jgi:ActD protein
MKRYGLLAEFRTAEDLIEAAKQARARGYRCIDAYSPIPLEGLVEATTGGFKDRVPLITLIGGILGGVGGFFLQWYTAVIDYPINVGGRPLNSWPSFIPATFELTVLGAALFGVFGMLAMNRLPQLYHPLFNVPEFELASRSRFFLCLRCDDPQFDESATHEFLQSLHPLALNEVPE